MDNEKRPLIGMTLAELKSAVKELGMPQFTASQIIKWLYQQHVVDIDEMTNISKANRERLKEQFEVGAMEPMDCQKSKDGTVKYLFPVRSQETGDRRQETGDRSQETGDRSQESGDRSQESGDRRQETGVA